MARNRRKSNKQRNTGKPRATQPERRAPVNVQPDTSAQHSKVRIAFRQLVQSLKKAKVLLSIIGVAALLLGFALDIDDAISKWLSRKRPAAEIMYFKKDGSNYNLIEPGNVILQPSKEELENNYVAVPVNLAVRNQEKSRLEATRVEISYPKGLRITPQGRPKIDPQNNTLIYEHDLRSLEPVTSFTPLDTIDVIYLHYAVKGLRTTAILHEDLVGVVASVGLEITDRPYGVDLQVKLFSRDRPPLATKLHLSIDTSHAYDDDPALLSGNEPTPGLLTNRDVILFQAVSRKLRAASRVWEVKIQGKPTTLALARTRHGKGLYSGLLLGGKVTEVYADSNGDGLLDYMLMDSSKPKSPDQKWLPSQPQPLTDMRRPDEVQLS